MLSQLCKVKNTPKMIERIYVSILSGMRLFMIFYCSFKLVFTGLQNFNNDQNLFHVNKNECKHAFRK